MRLLATSVLAGALMAGCSSTSATLHLFDAPPDGVTAVNIFVASMDVHVVDKDDEQGEENAPNDASIDDDDKWKSLDVNKSIDLVAHQGEGAAEVLGDLGLPEGKITQIRLKIDTTEPNTATYDGADCDLDVSRVDAKGIKINHAFKAVAVNDGDGLDIFVDFDLAASLRRSGDCFELAPKLTLVKVERNGEDVPVE